jgi:prophage regulatory protein
MTLLNISEVCTVTKMSRATVYRLMERANFPRPIAMTRKIRRWRRIEIEAWINQQAGNRY